MADFSSIPAEVLGLIFEHISKNPFLDSLSFSELSKEWRSIVGVSKDWKSIAIEKLRHLLPRAILLSLQDEEKPPLLELRGKLCLASNNGWLLIADICQMFLLNPLSKHQIPLPSPPCNLHNTTKGLIFTVKFNSTTNYQVSICKDMSEPRYFTRIFTCKAEDEKWTVLKARWPQAEDVAYYNQKLYVIYDLEHFHVFSEINVVRKHKVFYRSSFFTDEDVYPEGRSYLVETPQKELLKIIRYTKKKNRGGNGKTIDFEVFKMDDKRIDENWLNEEEETGDEVLDKVEDLGENVVFLGVNSLCLLAQDVPGCTANSIYFSDYQDDIQDRGVFSMVDREIKPLFQDRPFQSAPTLWFTPNVWS